MASNFVLTINSVDSESINFSVNFTSGIKNYTAGYVSVSSDNRIEEVYSLTISLANHSPQTYNVINGGVYTYNYIRPKDNLGNLSWEFIGALKVTQKIYTGQWSTTPITQSFGPYQSYQYPNINTTPSYKPNSSYPSSMETASLDWVYPVTDPSTGAFMYYNYMVTLTTYTAIETTTPATTTQELSSTKIIYPHPVEFAFNNCISGKQWEVDKGINSLITNIEDFYLYATQWKSWKQQSAANWCSQFDSPISAARMNEISSYVETQDSYSKGDKVSAAMFNNLASAINSG